MNLFKDAMLKLFLTICVFYTLLQFGAAVVERIPPYKEGICLTAPQSPIPMQLQIVKNHVLERYSDVVVVVLTPVGFVGQEDIAPFEDLRNLPLEETKCLEKSE